MRFPIASDGWRFILPLFFGGVLFLLFPSWLKSVGALLLLLAAFSAFFFRDFDRVTPPDPLAFYSPADGRVLEIARVADGPNKGNTLIRIFLSVFNVHVQRSPVDGIVKDIRYQKGLFLDARDIEAHVKNEQNSVVLETAHGDIVVTQIAGLIARRIVCWVKNGAVLKQGERYGLIRFGSQVDVILPPSAAVSVGEGDTVSAGLTVLARFEK